MTDNSLTTDSNHPRRRYGKPTLTSFGLVRDLTANFSGSMDEQSPDCSMNKIYTAACMGGETRPTRN